MPAPNMSMSVKRASIVRKPVPHRKPDVPELDTFSLHRKVPLNVAERGRHANLFEYYNSLIFLLMDHLDPYQ
jgi:hypothetical protein